MFLMPQLKRGDTNSPAVAHVDLDGGPGTGKTTVIKGIVELYAELHGVSMDINDYKKEGSDPFPFVLAAPTGRAAKRMAESTGLPAVTMPFAGVERE